MSQKARAKTICYCNSVDQATIEKAIRDNKCKSLDEIFDATFAGVGGCGGSCRPYLLKMLRTYLETGQFPESTRPSEKSKK